MIKAYLNGNLDIPNDAFKTLTKTYESLGDLEVINLSPPRPINRIPNPPIKINVPRNINITTQNVFILKDEDMSQCINELEYNPLFIKMKIMCEVC